MSGERDKTSQNVLFEGAGATATEEPSAGTQILSVSQLTKHIKRLLEEDTLLEGVWVQGEVSNLVKAPSGHWYFSLKDSEAVIRAALWAGNRRRLKQEFKNGDLIAAFGSISLYPPRGEYQLNVTDVRPAGLGALYEAFEKLKAKLQAEGLFDQQRKKPLPFLPRGVGIVTSPKGAVIQDIYRVIRRRFPNMPLYLVPAKVQGEGAADEITAGIRRLDLDDRVDVIILARGGGSLEDLWTFNEESVARAIAAAKKPIISAIGHETDFTIADFVADKRAATPSVAGELAVPVKEDLIKNVLQRRVRLNLAMKNLLAVLRKRLEKALACRFLKKPALLVAERRTKLSHTARELESACSAFRKRFRHALELLTAKLTSLDPSAVLKRGYLLAEDLTGSVVTSAAKLFEGQQLRLRFSDGGAGVTVNKIEKTVIGGKNG